MTIAEIKEKVKEIEKRGYVEITSANYKKEVKALKNKQKQGI